MRLPLMRLCFMTLSRASMQSLLVIATQQQQRRAAAAAAWSVPHIRASSGSNYDAEARVVTAPHERSIWNTAADIAVIVTHHLLVKAAAVKS